MNTGEPKRKLGRPSIHMFHATIHLSSMHGSMNKFEPQKHPELGRKSATMAENFDHQRNSLYPSQLDSRRLPSLPTHLEPEISDRRQLVAACILDEFSAHAFRPEVDLAHLTMEHWLPEITAAQPDMLLVESAWRGYKGTWWNTVSRFGPELKGIIDWCKERGVPTAFWNKEDPVHFQTFLTTASLFDTVFTTDLSCIAKYKKQLGHERVFLLPFAAQPKHHNPFEEYERIQGCAFAGAYYTRYPERVQDFAELSEVAKRRGPFHIYDRNHQNEVPGYNFPETYRDAIVGGALPPTMMHIPYKAYTENLNLNSVKQSQSMFARRVFELMLSNTLVISNFSRGLRLMLGALTVSSDSSNEIERRLLLLDSEPNGRERLLSMALRKALTEHTYQERVNYIATKLDLPSPASDPQLCALFANVEEPQESASIVHQMKAQTHHHWVIILIGTHIVSDDKRVLSVASLEEGLRVARELHCQLAGWVNPRNYYGENYLLDLVHAHEWSNAWFTGHNDYYVYDAGKSGLMRNGQGRSYRAADSLRADRGLVRFGLWDRSGRPSGPNSMLAGYGVSVGPTEFCEDGRSASVEELSECLPLPIDVGISIEGLRAMADNLHAHLVSPPATVVHDAHVLFSGARDHEHARILTKGDHVVVHSKLAPGSHNYLSNGRIHDLGILEDAFQENIHFDASHGAEVALVIHFMNKDSQRIHNEFLLPGVARKLKKVPDAENVSFSLRVAGAGEAVLRGLCFGEAEEDNTPILGRTRTAIVTNVYPTYDNLYRNGFIHSRVRSYQTAGSRLGVLRVSENRTTPAFAEFEDVDSAWISPNHLSKTLEYGALDSLAVHFLNPAIWRSVQPHLQRVEKLNIWIHGAEVQPWWRREFNFTNETQLEVAKQESVERLEFWRVVFAQAPSNVHFIFVSQYFAEEVFEDVGVRLDSTQYSVIHNPIDTTVFPYVSKPLEQRARILSIRPYASRKYANDLSVSAVLHLKERQGFDKLEFCFVGDGPLFEETVAPLRGLSNVEVRREFLTHTEISKMHKQFGVFLTPTRMDAQGVSRDEAMASGLVPITTRVAAVPEFVDDDCGVLAEAEDYVGLASGIWRVAHDPQLFARLSRNSAGRVRRQTATDIVLPKELDLLWNRADPVRTNQGSAGEV